MVHRYILVCNWYTLLVHRYTLVQIGMLLVHIISTQVHIALVHIGRHRYTGQQNWKVQQGWIGTKIIWNCFVPIQTFWCDYIWWGMVTRCKSAGQGTLLHMVHWWGLALFRTAATIITFKVQKVFRKPTMGHGTLLHLVKSNTFGGAW